MRVLSLSFLSQFLTSFLTCLAFFLTFRLLCATGTALAFVGHDSSMHFASIPTEEIADLSTLPIVADETTVSTIKLKGLPFKAVACVDDEKLIAVGHDATVALFQSIGHHRGRKREPALSSSWSYQGDVPVSTAGRGLPLRGGKLHENMVNGLVVMDAARFSTCGSDGRVVIWDLPPPDRVVRVSKYGSDVAADDDDYSMHPPLGAILSDDIHDGAARRALAIRSMVLDDQRREQPGDQFLASSNVSWVNSSRGSYDPGWISRANLANGWLSQSAVGMQGTSASGFNHSPEVLKACLARLMGRPAGIAALKTQQQLQLGHVVAVRISGSPADGDNGVYLQRPDHDGMPRYEKVSTSADGGGRHLYASLSVQHIRDIPTWHVAWRISGVFTPDESDASAIAYIRSASGLLPYGTQTWLHRIGGLALRWTNVEDSGWVDCALTVELQARDMSDVAQAREMSSPADEGLEHFRHAKDRVMYALADLQK